MHLLKEVNHNIPLQHHKAYNWELDNDTISLKNGIEFETHTFYTNTAIFVIFFFLSCSIKAIIIKLAEKRLI